MRIRTYSFSLTVAALSSMVMFSTACPESSGSDAGTEDAGGGNVVTDAGGGGGGEALGEGETCSVNNPQCDEGLFCVPSALNPNIGVCRIDCGLRDDTGVIVDEDPEACPSNLGCLVVIDPVTFDATAVACLPPQTARDGNCLSPGDDDACAAPYSCHVTYVSDGEDDAPTSFNCKQECDPTAANGGCPAGESCFQSNLIQDAETDALGDILVCTLATCEAGDAGCECGEGFQCIQLNSSAEGQGGCVNVPDVCGTPSDGLTIARLNGQNFNGVLCNDVDDHLYCDNDQFEGLDDPGASICFYQGALSASDNYLGFCFEFCSAPDADLDGDGMLEADNVGDGSGDDEFGQQFQCPEGKGCYLDLGRELLVGPGVDDPNSQFFGVKECNPDNCTPGQPCPGECGPGSTECITFESTLGLASLCIAPYGNCEPLRDEPVVDAGPTTDAGTETDAGLTTDAGTETDAGLTTDAGTETDAGVTDAG